MKITCVSALRQLLLDLNCSSALDQFRKDGGTGQCLSDVMLWLLPCPIYHLLADRCSWLFSDTNMYIITPPLSKHLKLVIKTLCVLEVIWFLSTCNLWCNLPSLYTGSFVSEFWFLEKTILLLLSYCVDRSLFGGGGGDLRKEIAFSSAEELFVLVYDILLSLHRSPRRRTASRSRSRYVTLQAVLMLVTRRSPQILSPHSWPSKESFIGFV